LVEAFFSPDRPFAGESFVTLGYDSVNPYRIEVSDLLAVTFLDVTVRPGAVRSIVGSDANDLSKLLRKVPISVNLWEASPRDMADARVLFERLRAYKWVKDVTAGKILARKRPALIPVVDRTVEKAIYAPPGRYWEAFRVALTDSNRRGRVDALPPSTLDTRIPLLRVLDAAIWMEFSGGTNAKRVRAQPQVGRWGAGLKGTNVLRIRASAKSIGGRRAL
jgi:Family of unknown function (DUF6308)